MKPPPFDFSRLTLSIRMAREFGIDQAALAILKEWEKALGGPENLDAALRKAFDQDKCDQV